MTDPDPKAVAARLLTRQQIADAIREEYDPKPSHWKADEKGWDDGADALACKIIALARREAADLLDTLTRERDEAREVLTAVTEHYCEIVRSGDCGFWDPETEEVIIAARAQMGKSR